MTTDMPVFDAHLHIIDPRFPLIENQGYLPDPFTTQDYQSRMSEYDVIGGAVVSGSFQGFDQGYLLAALNALGPAFAGVTQVPATLTDEELSTLHDGGVRAVRFNLKRGGSAGLADLDRLAHRVHERFGWHVELYVDATLLGELKERLLALPAVSIDHLGLRKAGFADLLSLVERGVRVKATGFGRVDMPVTQALRDLYAANASALMFGSDLPSTRAPRPYQHDDYLLIREVFDDSAAARVLWQNAQQFYRLA